MKMNRLEKKFVNSERHALGNQEVIDRMREFLDFPEAKYALEIGCGAGDLASYLARTHNLHVTGTDVDPEQIDIARARHGTERGVSFQIADAASLPFDDGSFDIVLSFKVLHHVRNWRSVLSEVSRVLKPGGFYMLNDFALPAWACRVLGGVARSSGIYTVSDASSALQENELTVTHEEPPRGVLLRHFSFITRKAS